MQSYRPRPKSAQEILHGLPGCEQHFGLLINHKDNFWLYQEIELLKASGVKSVKKITDHLADNFIWSNRATGKLTKTYANEIYHGWENFIKHYRYREIKDKILNLSLDPNTFHAWKPKQYAVPKP
jgi:hypothetical protein